MAKKIVNQLAAQVGTNSRSLIGALQQSGVDAEPIDHSRIRELRTNLMELEEYCYVLEKTSLAKSDRIALLEADRNEWRKCAERLGRQVAGLTHNMPTDIPLKEQDE